MFIIFLGVEGSGVSGETDEKTMLLMLYEADVIEQRLVALKATSISTSLHLESGDQFQSLVKNLMEAQNVLLVAIGKADAGKLSFIAEEVIKITQSCELDASSRTDIII